MKKSLVVLALLAAFGAQAQTADSNSGSNSNSGAISGSSSGLSATNSGNASANSNASQSSSDSRSGAASGSISGAQGNNVTLNQNTPATQTINSSLSGTTTNNQNTTLNGTQTVNNRLTGGTSNNDRLTTDSTNRQISSGGTNDTVRYEYGSQTIKNVPSIAMSGPASGPCTGFSGGISAAGPGFGVGLNGSAVMADCRLRENTRVLGMGMQSLDGTANPQEKAEATVMFMDSMRALAEYNAEIANGEIKGRKERK